MGLLRSSGRVGVSMEERCQENTCEGNGMIPWKMIASYDLTLLAWANKPAIESSLATAVIIVVESGSPYVAQAVL